MTEMSLFWVTDGLFSINDDMPDRCVYSSGDVIKNEYKVLKELGEGTFGAVYKVEDSVGKIYALKLLKLWEVPPGERDILRKRFDMEYETGQIDSDFLVHSYSHGTVSDNPYIVMEYCPGGDLRSKKNNMQQQLMLLVGSNVLCGLRDLHRCGKVHRDLKPDNVLFRTGGTAVLTDFGISGDQNKRMTERGWLGKPKQIFGTYAYMPPEQVKPPRGGSATVLPTTDIFSFGVMMYELIVGKLPFGELRTEADLVPYLEHGKEGRWDRIALGKHQNDSVRWLELIEGCLNPDFHKRFQNVDEVLSFFPVELRGTSNNSNRTVSHGRMRLRIMQGEEYGRIYEMESIVPSYKSVITVGRQSEDTRNDVPIVELNSCYVSRKHCTIERNRRNETWYVRDGQWDRSVAGEWKNSLNGTFLNSTEVSTEGTMLQDGDIISVGDVKLRVEIY